MKFLKGKYLFTETEIRKLMILLGKQEFVDYNGKKYISLDIEKKSDEVDFEKFKEVIFMTDIKKEMIRKLGTSNYKFSKFCREQFKTEDIKDIRFILSEQKKNK